MSITEKREVTIPPCKLDRSDLKEICQLIEDESKKITEDKENSYINLKFEIKSKDREIRSKNTESFLNAKFPKKLQHLFFHLTTSSDKEIWIWIYFSFLDKSYFTVEGEDPTWVNGITSRLEDIFKSKRNKGEIFQKSQTIVIIGIGLSIALGIGMQLLTWSFFPEVIDTSDHYDALFITSAISAMPIIFLFLWLGTPIEFENYLIQTKIKKIVFSALGIFILGILIAGISKFIFGLD